MIHFLTGNILDSNAEALVNTVNLIGVMGKGIALQFKKAYPKNYIAYKTACQNGGIAIGKSFVTQETSILGKRIIINFPTKSDWRKPSEYEYIERGLDNLVEIIQEYGIRSIAIPPLGSGNGGLCWSKVKDMIVSKLHSLDIDVFIYEPSADIVEQLKSERVKLTGARALLLYVLIDLVRQGEFVSEFSSEKVCYFLQKFGACDIFKLQFTPQYYGPYSGKVKYVLNHLNGSYIKGYNAMSKKPFEPISLAPDSYPEIKNVVENNERLMEIAMKTTTFLDGFYSDFGLELLSSVDYILNEFGTDISNEDIYQHLRSWTNRKGELFSDYRYIEIARNRIQMKCPTNNV